MRDGAACDAAIVQSVPAARIAVFRPSRRRPSILIERISCRANGDRMSVHLEKRANGVAVVTLDRPQALNALDVPAKERLGAIWQEISDDASVRGAILAGAGEKAFCA